MVVVAAGGDRQSCGFGLAERAGGADTVGCQSARRADARQEVRGVESAKKASDLSPRGRGCKADAHLVAG